MLLYNSNFSPVHKNIIANFFKIAVIFTNQILLVPAYLHYLGIDLYSDWIVITAITSFFTMTDVGISSVSNNLFTIKYNQNSLYECRVILFNNLIFTAGILTIVLLLFGCIGSFLNLPELLKLHSLSQSETLAICLLFIFQILLIMSGNIFDSVFNAIHSAHIATYLNNLAKLFNALFIFIGLILHLKLWIIVGLSTLPYLFIGIYKYIYSRSKFNFDFSISLFQLKYFKSIIRPALGFMFFPAGNAILFQGMTLVINSQLGAWPLVLFNTTRTMTNFIRNLVQAISAGIKPEFSIAYAKKDILSMKKLYRKSFLWSFVFALAAAGMLLIGGEIIYNIWTKNQIKFDAILAMILCITLIVNSVWESTCITMTSTNRHFFFSLTYLVTTVITIPIAYYVTKTFESIYVAAATMIIVDVIMAITSLYMSQKLMKTIN